MRNACGILLLGVVSAGLLQPAAAQQATAQLAVGAGTATDLRGVRSAAYAIAPSLSILPGPNFALSLAGRGTRYSSGSSAIGGSGAAVLRIPFAAGLALSLAGNGDAVRTSYHASYLSAEGIPALEWRSGRWALWGGIRGAAAQSTEETPGTVNPVPLAGRATSLTRSLVGPAFGGALRLAGSTWGGGPALSVSYREEHSHPDGIAVTDRTAGLSLSRGSLALAGTVGLRQAMDEPRGFGSARISLALTPAIALSAAAESYPSNRLTGTPGGRAFTAGLVLRIGGSPRQWSAPKPAGVPPVGRALTRLSLSAPGAASVEVAGDWNAWRPVGLRKASNGVWYVDLAIPRGSYRYAFHVDGKSWEVPRGAAAVDDGFGGKSAWLTVGEPGKTETQSANRKEAP